MNIILYNFTGKQFYKKLCGALGDGYNIIYVTGFSKVFIPDILSGGSCVVLSMVNERNMDGMYDIIKLIKIYNRVKFIAVSDKFTTKAMRECFLNGALDCIETSAELDFFEYFEQLDTLSQNRQTPLQAINLADIENHDYLNGRLYIDIIEKRYNDISLERRGSDLNLKIYIGFFVIAIKIDYPFEKAKKSDFEDFSDCYCELLKHYVLDLENVFFPYDYLLCTKHEDMLLCFVNTNQKNIIEINIAVNGFFEKLRELFFIHTDLDIIGGVGRVKDTLVGIRSSLNEARTAVENGFYKLNESFFRFDGKKAFSETELADDYLMGIDATVEMKDKEQVIASLLIALDRLTRYNISIRQYLHIIEVILYRVLFLAPKHGFKFSLVNESNEDIFRVLKRMSRVDKMKNALNNFLNYALKYNNNLSERKNESVTRVKNYIFQYFNTPITLNLVADHVHLNPNYLSEMFRRETGENFYSFLTNVRMIEAKRLLLETDTSIKDIAVSCGYAEIISFSRAFKKVYKTSPSQYRKMTEAE